MESVWWIVAVVCCTAITAGLVYFVMQSHAEVQLARQREELAFARAELSAKRQAMLDSLYYAEEVARSQALNEFLSDIRVEERHYVREHKVLFMTRRSIVRQERIFFRNLPLSNWIEHEMPYEEGVDVDQLSKAMAVFVPSGMLEPASAQPRNGQSGNGLPGNGQARKLL